MSEIVIKAHELDPDKKYLILLDRHVGALELVALRDALKEVGFQGLIWRGPLSVIDFDQIKGYIEVPE